METHWAAQNLQVIRTLMERAAVYRRTLAPIMLLIGSLGLIASATAYFLALDRARFFVCFWLAVSVAGIAGAYLLMRRQALRAGENFWSLPTRRVTQAFLPPLVVGFAAGLLLVFPRERDTLLIWWVLPLWMGLYGCGIHAAGFFMRRGIKLLGWIFIATGFLVACWLARSSGVPQLILGHVVMGLFGLLHFAYGVYLYFTETPTDML